MESVEDAGRYGSGLLLGHQVRLRALYESDLERLAAWWARPATAVLQGETVKPQPESAVQHMLRQWSGNDTDGAAAFSVVARESGDLVGHVALWGATVATRCAELAVIIGDDHTGHGYGTDAVRVMVRYGFEEMGLNRLELRTWSFNTRALATYRKLGFVEEGRRRQVVFHQGAFHDQVLLGMLADEWRAGQI